MFLNKTTLIILICLLCQVTVSAQDTFSTDVYIDDDGFMRWGDSKQEVKGFGFNYSVPFAHAYRTAKRLSIDPKEAILNDVYHFKRLGFDLYRLHVWDTQISDVDGNLLENEYLDTFDFLLHTLKTHNINYVITPIAFWGNGWPEPDIETPGFSYKYGKGDCLTNPEAIKAQENYLFQFLNHVNPYNGIAYKDDPNVIAFEVSNEPHHRGEASEVTKYIKKMVDAMRKTGSKKPIFYNMSHAIQFTEAYFKGGAQGGTFQWYPTGLGYQKELKGNLLPNVNDYNMPMDSIFKKYKGAKLVYEFDAADVGRSYIYPVMARSFREAGIQIATHFAYDPTYMADVNTEYNTHYMNLCYTPQKALSLKICGEVFRNIPMYSDFGTYPKNISFGDFSVDYESDLAVYNSGSKFIYTNSTSILPKNELLLTEIAGFGNSPIIDYDGLGSYFLDKIDDGLWRLEVMPDAVWVNNPFGRNSPDKTVGAVQWNNHNMTLHIKDLGTSFKIEGINESNTFKSQTESATFSISPGTYMLTAHKASKKWSANDVFKGYLLKSFYAPKSKLEKSYFKHDSPKQTSLGRDLKINLQYVSKSRPNKIELFGTLGNERIRKEMTLVDEFRYETVIEKEKLNKGFLNYYVVVTDTEGNTITYPAGKKGSPFDWDFYDRSTFKTTVIDSKSPLYLFNALEDAEDLVIPWRRENMLVPTKGFNEAEFQIHLDKLFYVDNENPNTEPIYDYTFKHFIVNAIKTRKHDLASKQFLVLRGRSLKDQPKTIQVAFVLKDGSAYGSTLQLNTDIQDHIIRLDDLKPVNTVTLPRPYPSFLPYYFSHDNRATFNIQDIESMQISIGPEEKQQTLNQSVSIAITSIWLE